MSNDDQQLLMEMQRHVIELRRKYYSVPSKSRINIANQLYQYFDVGIKDVALLCSLIEAVSRSIIIHSDDNSLTVEEKYEKYRNTKVIRLVNLVFGIKHVNIKNELGIDWDFFKMSVKYRNLFVHEATFLNQEYSSKLISACEKVYKIVSE
ncbi:MAG TPA: hypothetical protein VJJ80_00980 [Patescibacteria group bacterium]|nr:hypothetical protein [Patescibacteria group bacterium]